jgi:hypothetical protein
VKPTHQSVLEASIACDETLAKARELAGDAANATRYRELAELGRRELAREESGLRRRDTLVGIAPPAQHATKPLPYSAGRYSVISKRFWRRS